MGGMEALTALGLLVDCRNRRLVAGCPGARSLKFARSGSRVAVEFANPNDPNKTIKVKALVDSGCTDVDLNEQFIKRLSLVEAAVPKAQFETAGGVTIEAPLYHVT